MAKLSAHGTEIGRLEFSTYAKAYCSDGKILKNGGFGWKLHAKVKPEIDPRQAFENAKRKRDEFRVNNPAYAAYIRELHSMCGLCKRWKLQSALELLGDDVDGIWSECCDGYGDNISASVDEVAELARLYGAAMIEQQARRSQNQAVES